MPCSGRSASRPGSSATGWQNSLDQLLERRECYALPLSVRAFVVATGCVGHLLAIEHSVYAPLLTQEKPTTSPSSSTTPGLETA